MPSCPGSPLPAKVSHAFCMSEESRSTTGPFPRTPVPPGCGPHRTRTGAPARGRRRGGRRRPATPIRRDRRTPLHPGRRAPPRAAGSATERRCRSRPPPRRRWGRRTARPAPGVAARRSPHQVDRDTRQGVSHPAPHPFLVEGKQGGVAEAEERQLVAVGPNKEVDSDGGAAGDGSQRVLRQELPVDDGQEGQRHHAGVRPALANLLRRGDELSGRDTLQGRAVARRHSQHSTQLAPPTAPPLRSCVRGPRHSGRWHAETGPTPSAYRATCTR